MVASRIRYRRRTRYRGLIATLLLTTLGSLAWWLLVRHVPAGAPRLRPPAPAHARAVATPPAGATASASADDGGAVAPSGAPPAPPSAPLGRTLDRAYAALAAAARSCAAHAAADANPAQHIRHHVRVDHGRVTNLQRVDGDMAPALVDCIEQHWRAARWNDDDQPRTVTLELVQTLDQLRHGR